MTFILITFNYKLMQQLKFSEIASTNGGLFGEVAIAVTIFAGVAYLYDNREQVMDGIQDGFCSLYGCS